MQKHKLQSLYQTRDGSYLARWYDENGPEHMRFYGYPKKEVISSLRNKYNVSVPHEFY